MKYRPQRREADVTAGALQPKRAATGTGRNDVRHSGAYKQLRQRFYEACRAADAVCWQCRQRIDYSAATRTADSFEADHLVSVKAAPALALVWDNLRPSHSKCNQARRDDKPVAQEEWVQPNW
jgi:hypothetical protein